MTKKKDPKDLKLIGRPTSYTPEIAAEICDAIASSNQGLDHLCNERPHWPTRACIFIWMRRYPDFFDKYAQAKEQQAEVQVDYMLALANEPHKYVDEETGRTKVDVPMLRVKIDAIKWQASKLAPKKFADKQEITIPSDSMLDENWKRKHELDEKNRKDY